MTVLLLGAWRFDITTTIAELFGTSSRLIMTLEAIADNLNVLVGMSSQMRRMTVSLMIRNKSPLSR